TFNFFFSSRRRHTRCLSDWSSDVCSSDLEERELTPAKFPNKSRIITISRGVRWQWLAPAGALAAGLLVWVAWHENQPLPWKTPRSEERRVGKECRCGWMVYS